MNHEDKCVGCLIGCAVGDILGANVEFRSRNYIHVTHGRIVDFMHSDRRPCGVFTDDTEMTVALADSLVACGRVDPQHCALSYVKYFSAIPRRGYGPAVRQSLEFIANGGDCHASGTLVFPDGSFANGGAMRISPVGLAYRHASDHDLRAAVTDALLCTHVHHEAIDGAFVQAKAISVLCNASSPHDVDVAVLLSQLHSAAESSVLQRKLMLVRQAVLEQWSDERVLDAVCTPNEYGNHFQIHAAEAVSCSLWAFANSPHDPEECIVRAVNLGGDTDTVGAMTGALVGALHGVRWVPDRWFNKIENAHGIGRDHIASIAKQLAAITCT